MLNAAEVAEAHPHRAAHGEQVAEAAAPRRPGEFDARHARRLPAGAAPGEISAAAILDALEGPIALTECVRGQPLRASNTPAPWAAPGSGSTSRSAVRSTKSRSSQLAGTPTPAALMPIERDPVERPDAAPRSRHDSGQQQWQAKRTTWNALVDRSYRHGFVTDIESDTLPPGLDEDVVRVHLAQEARTGVHDRLAPQGLSPLAHDEGAALGQVRVNPIDYQAISYFSAPKRDPNAPKSLDEVDPKLLATYEKLGVPLHERARARGRRGRCGVRQRLGGDHVQGEVSPRPA